MTRPLRFENVSVVFDDGTQALEDISFSVEEKETRIILEQRRAGKTCTAEDGNGPGPGHFGKRSSCSMKM